MQSTALRVSRFTPAIVAAALLVSGGAAGLAATAEATNVPPDISALERLVPAPHPDDVRSIESLVAALYDTISGPIGDRDWDRLRSLMLPTAHLTASIIDEHGQHVLRSRSVEEYIARAREVFATEAFYERSLTVHVQHYGNIAHAYSSYASSHERGGQPFQRGINSLQLVYDGQRWWLASIIWDVERPGNLLPGDMSR